MTPIELGTIVAGVTLAICLFASWIAVIVRDRG
jgi:hypothetical protein